MTAKRILVTGSEGFVGRHLIAELAARGCEAVRLDKQGDADVLVDLSSPSLDARALAARIGKVDAVIYMAATITRGSSVDAAARANLRAIAEAPCKLLEALDTPHLVYCSTYKTYGPQEGEAIDPESHPQKPDPHSYGSAKALGERLVRIASERTGFGLAIVRPTCIYGPGQHLHNAIPRFLSAALAGEAPVVFGEGTSLRDDVYAPDLCRLMADAAITHTEGTFNAGGERATTVLELAERCCEAAHALGAPRLLPRVVADRAPKWWLDQRFDLTPSRRQLGYAPTPLVEGLLAEATWLKAGAHAADSTRFVLESSPGRPSR